ncbi:VUT family protein [Oscillatoria sp. CS-180]|uniref:VUT family protein n=1 Tax=Oscillatoria sp. CS-180 TaxID=3021720 RepID=UPI00232DBDC8|nr:VUT family protein [Oscillatoria sp. CS-180]MDB9524885.1 VUT family protein [Oscillatoria sp. CS-180]
MSRTHIINACIYILATLGANYTADWFIPLPVFGQVAVGTFVFGITFTQRDRLHSAGRKWIYLTIAAAATANICMSVLLAVPIRIILASFFAIVLAETADTEIYQQLLPHPWLVRVAGSNAVSIVLDTLLFTLIAFAGVLPTAEIVSLLFGETITKYAIGILFALWRQGKFIWQEN